MRNELLAILAAALLVAGCEGVDDREAAIGSDTSAAAADRMLSPAGGAVDLGDPIFAVAFREIRPDTSDEITGTARVFPDTVLTDSAAAGRGFRLEVVLDGLSTGGHAWHIHHGGCDEDGPIAVPLTDTPRQKGIAGPLEADAEFTARALVSVSGSALPLTAFQQATYSLDVHQGVGLDPGRVVACAELSGSA